MVRSVADRTFQPCLGPHCKIVELAAGFTGELGRLFLGLGQVFVDPRGGLRERRRFRPPLCRQRGEVLVHLQETNQISSKQVARRTCFDENLPEFHRKF